MKVICSIMYIFIPDSTKPCIQKSQAIRLSVCLDDNIYVFIIIKKYNITTFEVE